jgi:hypothetical protein
MRRLLTAFLLGISLMTTTAAQAGSPPVIFSFRVQDTATIRDVVPCQESLGEYNITINERGFFRVTAAALNADDEPLPPYHLTSVFTGSFAAVPSDGTGPTFTGHFVERFGENVNRKNSTGTFTFSVHGRSPSGRHVSFHEVFHYRINANGVETSFDKPSC